MMTGAELEALLRAELRACADTIEPGPEGLARIWQRTRAADVPRETENTLPGVTDRAGPRYERDVADYAHDVYGFPWDKAPPRGRRDRLDITGSLDYGWLIGCKAIHRGVQFGARISEAMTQADQALVNVGRPFEQDPRGFLVVDSGRIVPVQVMQRSGYPIGKHYAVTQLDYLLRLAQERAESDREIGRDGRRATRG